VTVYEQQQEQKKTDSIRHQCLTLAKLLESKPSTLADESRLAMWADNVDRTAATLVTTLGRRDAISVMLANCAELIQEAGNVEEFIRQLGFTLTPGENPWLKLKDIAQRIQHQREQERAEATIAIRDLTNKHAKISHDWSKAVTDVDAMSKELQAYRDAGVTLDGIDEMRAELGAFQAEKAKRRKRVTVDETSGIKVIDYGDDD